MGLMEESNTLIEALMRLVQQLMANFVQWEYWVRMLVGVLWFSSAQLSVGVVPRLSSSNFTPKW
jgi:hypothetical protein